METERDHLYKEIHQYEHDTEVQAAEITRLREALEWIVRVNAMGYEYREIAQQALKQPKEPS